MRVQARARPGFHGPSVPRRSECVTSSSLGRRFVADGMLLTNDPVDPYSEPLRLADQAPLGISQTEVVRRGLRALL